MLTPKNKSFKFKISIIYRPPQLSMIKQITGWECGRKIQHTWLETTVFCKNMQQSSHSPHLSLCCCYSRTGLLLPWWTLKKRLLREGIQAFFPSDMQTSMCNDIGCGASSVWERTVHLRLVCDLYRAGQISQHKAWIMTKCSIREQSPAFKSRFSCLKLALSFAFFLSHWSLH